GRLRRSFSMDPDAPDLDNIVARLAALLQGAKELDIVFNYPPPRPPEVLTWGQLQRRVAAHEGFVPASQLDPNHNRRRRFLQAHPEIRTKRLWSWGTRKPIANRLLVHAGDYAKAAAAATAAARERIQEEVREELVEEIMEAVRRAGLPAPFAARFLA